MNCVDSRRRHVVNIRLTEDERRIIQEAAAELHMTVSEYTRRHVLPVARAELWAFGLLPSYTRDADDERESARGNR